jgi:hypothetical protein
VCVWVLLVHTLCVKGSVSWSVTGSLLVDLVSLACWGRAVTSRRAWFHSKKATDYAGKTTKSDE